jgi:hypothetical protein
MKPALRLAAYASAVLFIFASAITLNELSKPVSPEGTWVPPGHDLSYVSDGAQIYYSNGGRIVHRGTRDVEFNGIGKSPDLLVRGNGSVFTVSNCGRVIAESGTTLYVNDCDHVIAQSGSTVYASHVRKLEYAAWAHIRRQTEVQESKLID